MMTVVNKKKRARKFLFCDEFCVRPSCAFFYGIIFISLKIKINEFSDTRSQDMDLWESLGTAKFCL